MAYKIGLLPIAIRQIWAYRLLNPPLCSSPRFTSERLKSEGYYSQRGQDKWIVETLLPGVVSGVFVDLGAHDGVSFSNTFYLEQKLGWTGLAVEPIPEAFQKLTQNRRCAVVNGCVGAKSGKARFQAISGYSEMLSGLLDEYNPKHRRRIDHELRKYGGECRSIEVNCYTLNELLDSHGINHIDYLSIDVEGAEYSVLTTLDFSHYSISVIGVENNYIDQRIGRLLKNNGFRLHSVVGDEFYVDFAH